MGSRGRDQIPERSAPPSQVPPPPEPDAAHTNKGSLCLFPGGPGPRPSSLLPLPPPATPPIPPPAFWRGLSLPLLQSLQQPRTPGHGVGQKGPQKAEKVGRVRLALFLRAVSRSRQLAAGTCSRCPGGQRQAPSPPATRHCGPLSAWPSWGRHFSLTFTLHPPDLVPPAPAPGRQQEGAGARSSACTLLFYCVLFFKSQLL